MSEEIVWKNPITHGYVVLHRTVMKRITSYRQSISGTKEAGGILLGYRRGAHLEIIDATTPFRRDIRKRTFFDRCDLGHQRYAIKQWARSGKTVDYLGEWHTHPERIPSPSHIDIREWRTLLRQQQYPLVFLIIGTHGMWMGCSNGAGIRKCDK